MNYSFCVFVFEKYFLFSHSFLYFQIQSFRLMNCSFSLFLFEFQIQYILMNDCSIGFLLLNFQIQMFQLMNCSFSIFLFDFVFQFLIRDICIRIIFCHDISQQKFSKRIFVRFNHFYLKIINRWKLILLYIVCTGYQFPSEKIFCIIRTISSNVISEVFYKSYLRVTGTKCLLLQMLSQ